jgi:phospholipid/cholesterol/gamma-HCH transport system substrate-binding protein
MKRAIEKNFKWVLTIVGLMAIAFGVATYILINQGNRLPWEEDTVRMTAVLDNAQAVTPGQGQQVQINGVQIGKIASVDLEDGRAVVGMDIEPQFVEDQVIRTDAQALLRPRTPLKDMFIQIVPGSMQRPAAGEGFQVPISRTMSDVDLDEILSTLDERTQDYLQLLARGAGEGLRGNGERLAEVFKRFGPTVEDLARVNRAVARERTALRRSITALARLNGRLAQKPEDLSELVTSAEATFAAFAAEDDNLRTTVDELPETLQTATRTLRDVRPFADELGPATQALIPTMRALTAANNAVRPAARTNTPFVRDQIRPFVRRSRPVVRDLVGAAEGLRQTFPEITGGARRLNRLFNMLGFNKDGREPADKAGRDEGYLFWLDWVSHITPNLINVDDANGPMRPIFLTGTCGTLTSLVNDFDPLSEFLMGLSPILAGVCGNPQTTSLSAEKALKAEGFPGAAKKLAAKREAGER